MSRSKKTPFPPWLSCNPDGNEKRYIRLGNTQLSHPATLSLSDKAFVIYIRMLLEAGGQREFVFPRTKYNGIAGHSTFKKVKDELIEKGFIREVQNNANLRKPNVYEFSEEWKRYYTD